MRKWLIMALMGMMLIPFLLVLNVVSAASPTVATTVTGSAVAVPGSANFIWIFNFPTGIVNGDLIVAEITALSATTKFSFDGDWTQISVRRAATFSTSSAYKNATGVESFSQFTVVFDIAPTAVMYIIYRIDIGTHSGLVYGVASASSNSSTPDPPNLAPGIGNQDWLWLAWESHASAATCTAIPASYSNLLNVNEATLGICSAQFAVISAASENPGIFTISVLSLWDAQTLGIAGKTWTVNLNGFNSLVKTTAESPGANCANSGIKIESGLDDGMPSGTARSGILEAGEVDSTMYVCNGATGPTGPAGINGFSIIWLLFGALIFAGVGFMFMVAVRRKG